jgi:LPXTG-motif cell wall-anchored protein
MTMSAPRRLAVAVSVPVVLASGLAVALPAEAATPGYHGSSFAIKVQVGLAGTTLLDQILPDAITFPSGGDTALLELPSELSEVATLKVLNAASAVTKDHILASNARTAQLSVLNNLVTASVLNSDCTAANLKLAGDSQVTGLAIAGTRIPIDPGPNFKVEIPTALAPFLSGGIYIDEQDTLPTGDLRIRALHVRLVVDPLGLQSALKAVTDGVRKVAEEVTGAVERATGKTLEALEAQARTARAAVAPAASTATATATTPKATTVDPRAGSHQNDARQSSARDAQVRSAVEQKAAHERLVAQRDAEAAAAEQQAVEAQGRADAAADAAAKANAAAEQPGAEASQESAPEQSTAAAKKSDRAAVPGRDAAGSDAAGGTTVSQAGGRSSTESWQQRAGRLRPEQAQEAAASAQADATEARKAADGAHARAEAARAGKAGGETAPAASGTRVATKSDRAAAAPAAATGPAQASVPAAEADNLGTVGVDVIVSQVTCKGFQAVKAVMKPAKPTDASSIAKPDLPKTGGNGNATVAVGATGLGLLLAGSGAVFAVRRRRHSA